MHAQTLLKNVHLEDGGNKEGRAGTVFHPFWNWTGYNLLIFLFHPLTRWRKWLLAFICNLALLCSASFDFSLLPDKIWFIMEKLATILWMNLAAVKLRREDDMCVGILQVLHSHASLLSKTQQRNCAVLVEFKEKDSKLLVCNETIILHSWVWSHTVDMQLDNPICHQQYVPSHWNMPLQPNVFQVSTQLTISDTSIMLFCSHWELRK